MPTYFEPQMRPLRELGLDERWVQDRIVENPHILGLGDLLVKDRERSQPTAGRLDILLVDSDTRRRYEVEVQLGGTDPGHIIRTIEYWDVEKRRYPQYEHCAVIIAEEITGRFLNVISLFNGAIPLIALRMQAIVDGDAVGLIFTKVLDEVRLGLEEDEEDVRELTNRSYWETKGSPKTVQLADRVLELIQTFAPGFELKFNKYYIGLASGGRSDNFVAFKPQRTSLRLEIKLPKSDETSRKLEEAGLEILGYDRYSGYKVRVSQEEIEKHRDLLTALMREAQND